MVLGTADAAKWVSRQKNRLTQPRATISTSMTAGRCGRPTAEAAERRLEAGVFAAFQSSDGGSVDFAEWVYSLVCIGQDSRRVLTRTVGEYLSGVDPVFSITD